MFNAKKLYVLLFLVALSILVLLCVDINKLQTSVNTTRAELVKQRKDSKQLRTELKNQKEKAIELMETNDDLHERLEQSNDQLNNAENQIDTLKTDNENLKKLISSSVGSNTVGEHVTKTIYMNATAYTASCKGCSGKTYTGLDLIKNPNLKVIAVDPRIIAIGTKVYVEGYGYAVAADKGGAIKGHKIDIFISSLRKAKQWGRKQVAVKILD